MTRAAAFASEPLPAVRLKKHEEKRLRAGHPWVYSNEIVMDAQALALAPGSCVNLIAASGALLGRGHFNPHTLIAARLLERDPSVVLDEHWLEQRLAQAGAWRTRLFAAPFYRLVHAEADGLPGLVVDRYGDVFVVEINTAGFARVADALDRALAQTFAPRAIVHAGDSPARAREGLAPDVRVSVGNLDGPLAVEENGVVYQADPLDGQKTGWFFDQRDNRAFIAGLSAGATVLDCYCYTGGFALAAAKGGAAHVYGIDRSRAALALAQNAAEANGLASRCHFEEADIFAALPALAAEGRSFDIVIADPPPFARTRKDVPAALKGYRKLARQAAQLTGRGGLLLLASCSHHVAAEALLAEAQRALADLGRSARLLRQAGAGPDHPIHPALPESAYLKALVFALD